MTLAATLRADPLADDTIASVFQAFPNEAPWKAIGIVNSQIAQWQTNGELGTWQADADVPPSIAAALQSYVQRGLALPEWAQSARIERAEKLFMEMSMMSCTLLFCASLPECYVVPELAGVLHAAGQLEQHTDYRVRSTAAMIFPVMMKGGLCSAAGSGVAQVLKVRLIHATIRHLILRGNPVDAVGSEAPGFVPPLPMATANMYQTLYANGWDVAQNGLPCNQQELAYTLLTFHYIFLRGLRQLGIGLAREDEEDYLHAWNVMGHVLGIERALMADTMAVAKTSFDTLQLQGRNRQYYPDARPALAGALMQVMEDQIPFRLLKPFPVMLTRHLCGPQTAQVLGISGRVNLASRLLFVSGMAAIRTFDAAVRLVVRDFSICRMLTRLVGYQFTVKLLMDETRPLKLPAALLGQVNDAMGHWQADRKAPRWLNALERRWSGRGNNPPPPSGEQPC
jgi:hypothetical protein